MEQRMKHSALSTGNTVLLEGVSNNNDLLNKLRIVLDPEENTFLQDVKWDHLMAHYSNLDLKQNLFAFGQELSTHDTALYAVQKENGNISIVPINKKEMKDFENSSTTSGKSYSLCLQEGKTFGEPAYRFDAIADRLPCETYLLESKDSYYIDFVGKQMFTKSPGSQPREYSYYHLDLSVWPPKKTYFTKPIINITYSSLHKLYAALELESENHFYIKKIRIGHDMDDLCSWDYIDLDEEIGGTHFFRWVELAWVGNDLLLLDENHLWCVEDAAIGGRTFKMISDINSCGCSLNCSPTVIKTNNGGTFIPSNKKIWEWKDDQLTNTGITITKLYGKRFSTAKLGKAGFITTTRRGRIAVDTQTDTGLIRFLDFVDAPSLTCVKELNNDWIIFFNNEAYAEHDSDLAQLWNHKTNQWLRIKYGMLDNSTIHDITLLNDGTAFIADNQGKLYRIQHFLEVLDQANTAEDKSLMSNNTWYDGRGKRKSPPSYQPPKVCKAAQAKKEMNFEDKLSYFSQIKLTDSKYQKIKDKKKNQ